MSVLSQYGTGQRIGFALLCIGLILCVIGAVAPNWMYAEVSWSDVSLGLASNIPLFGGFIDDVLDDHNVVTINLGVWVYCIDNFGSEEKCFTLYGLHQDELRGLANDEEDGIAWIQYVRGACCLNLLLGLFCGLAACCRCMCSDGGRTVCHGIFAFCAGGSGIFAFAVMLARREELVPDLPFFEMELDFAFYLYASGSCAMVLSAFLLCFAVPNETHTGMVMPMHAAGPPINMVTSYQTPQVFAVPMNQQYQHQHQHQHQGPPPTPQPMFVTNNAFQQQPPPQQQQKQQPPQQQQQQQQQQPPTPPPQQQQENQQQDQQQEE